MIDSIIWLLLLVAFLIIEGITVSMVSTWFAGGALAALVVSLFPAPAWLQVTVFLVVSIALLCMLRPFVKKQLLKHTLYHMGHLSENIAGLGDIFSHW